MSKHLSRLLLITLFIAVVSSCGSSRKNAPAIGGYTPGGQQTTPGRSSLTWTDLRVPVSVNISSPSSLRVSGVMTMVNDKDIHISLRLLGFEVGAAYITGDSIYAYAKLQRGYVAESIGSLLGGVNATVADVQALLIGAPLTMPRISGNTTFEMQTSELTGQPLSITVSHPSGRTGSISYTPLEGTPLASSVAIAATTGQKRLAATLNYDWSRAEADTGASKSFSIPNGYRRIDATALLKSLSAGK